jgi:GNAT superfamily N-acetyltransferase
MAENVQIIDRLPTVEEHRVVFEAVGWHPYAPQAAEIALRNSLFSVVAMRGDQVVGIGRIVGDGGKFFYIQDVAVRPEYQARGIGKQIVNRLIAWINENAPPEPFVGLFATGVAIPFYRQYGFEERRDILSGMWTVLPAANHTPGP